MIHLDQYVDTAAKRKCLFHIFYLLLTGWIIYSYLQTALTLIQIDTYDEMFQVLEENSLSGCYMARVVLLCMSMPSFHVTSLFLNVIKALRFIDILFIAFTCLVWFGDVYKKVRKKYLMIPIGYIIQLLCIVMIALFATQATSFMSVIAYVQIIGCFMICVQACLIILCFIYILQAQKDYKEALLYDAVEISDV